MQIYRLRKSAQAVSTSFVAKFAHVCTIHIHTIYSGKRKRSANCLCFLAKGNFLLQGATEGAPYWCDIKISCLLLPLRIVFESLHLYPVQNESTDGH